MFGPLSPVPEANRKAGRLRIRGRKVLKLKEIELQPAARAWQPGTLAEEPG